MKKLLKQIVAWTLVITMLCPITAMASTKGRYMLDKKQDEVSVLLPETVKQSVGRDIATGRSKALASALCSITNLENGNIHIYAETAMFISVDWAALTIYLEKWNDDTSKWSTVETFEKEFTPADKEDGQLTSVELSIDVGTQPVGHYYRIRCIHELEYDNGWYEAKSTKTDGVLLTNIK